MLPTMYWDLVKSNVQIVEYKIVYDGKDAETEACRIHQNNEGRECTVPIHSSIEVGR